MAAEGLEETKNQVQDIINSMEEEGMVDLLFRSLHAVQGRSGPLFLASVLPSFSRNTTAILGELKIALDKPELNYYQLDEMCIEIKRLSSSIGACRFYNACTDLQQAIETEESKERNITALNAAKQEHSLLLEKIHTIVELELKIAKEKGLPCP